MELAGFSSLHANATSSCLSFIQNFSLENSASNQRNISGFLKSGRRALRHPITGCPGVRGIPSWGGIVAGGRQREWWSQSGSNR